MMVDAITEIYDVQKETRFLTQMVNGMYGKNRIESSLED
jgi:hypothetical protein